MVAFFKTQALKKSMGMNMWVFCALNQPFRRGSHVEINFSKKMKQLQQISVLCNKFILYFPLFFSVVSRD